MSSLANLLGKTHPPSAIATSSAVKADLRRLAQDYAQSKDTDWPSTALLQLSIATARDLFADQLSAEALAVIDAVIACDNAQRETVYGQPRDYKAAIDTLSLAADAFADETFETCRVHLGESE